MCGIFVVFERGQPINEALALLATRRLRHRGPDGTGSRSFAYAQAGAPASAAVNAFFGHTRLSILDVSTRSNQPFRRGARTLVYNGEIYNFRALRDDLRRRGTSFETDGDTEVLLELLAQRGVNALGDANGMWAFCLFDETAGVLTAGRDRYGKKPLFYYADATTLCLASEIAPIFTYLGRQPEFVAADVDTYLRHGWLFPNADGSTHIESVRQVRAGATLSFDLAAWTLSERHYFDLEEFSSATAHAPDDLAAILSDAIVTRLVSDRNVGLLLSGGVDSSLVLSVLAARGLAEHVTCFTGDAGKSDDAFYARQCVDQLRLKHINVPLDYGAGSMQSFLDVCRHQEKPFPFIGNVLAAPQLYARIAEYDVPVVLDGAGGDEIFAGYWYRYYRFAAAEAVAAGDDDWLAATRSSAAAGGDVSDFAATLKCQEPANAIARLPEDPLDLDTFVHPTVCNAPSSDPLDGYCGTLAEALVTDAARGRLHEWLWQNDRNAMMSGIENRSPLLDYRLAPYMHSNYAQKFAGPWNKHELRSLFTAFTPLPTQWRREKQGFRWVYSRFLRHNREPMLELIAASRILPRHVDVHRLLGRARTHDDYLRSGLLERMLCIAGLEATMVVGGAQPRTLSVPSLA